LNKKDLLNLLKDLLAQNLIDDSWFSITGNVTGKLELQVKGASSPNFEKYLNEHGLNFAFNPKTSVITIFELKAA
jgi:hypothetical protein